MSTPTTFFEDEALAIGQAIEEGDVAMVRKLCHPDVELNSLHKQDMTLLHFAMLKKNPEMLQVLTEAGASPHISIEGVGSVLYCAILAKETDYLTALLKAGVDANSTDSEGTPLFFHAAIKEDLAALKLLLEHGADLNLTNQLGRTAIVHSLYHLMYDQVEFMIDRPGVDLKLSNQNGVTIGTAVQLELNKQKVNTSTPAYQKLVDIRNNLASKGIQFPT